MSKKAREIIIEGMAEHASIQELLHQKEKSRREDVKEEIREELKRRTTCPICSNEMFLDEEEGELYCPVGCHSHSI